MAAPHSGPYLTGDPNKPESVVDVEAALAYEKLRRGYRPDDICKELGLSRRTFYRRIENLILAQDRPSRSFMRLLEADRLEDLSALTTRLLDGAESGGISTADAARLLAEARQQSAARRALFGLDEKPDREDAPDEPEPDEQMTEWIAAEDAEAREILDEVRGVDAR